MKTYAICLGALLFPVIAGADSVRLRTDDVIPVIMQTELTFRDTREGDTFRADVNDASMLPAGSRLEGVVHRVVQKDGDRKAFMDIEFTAIILPDGHRTRFHGTPIPLSKNYVVRDREGRWEAKKGVTKETVVLGATAGGLILGSMIHKPFEGAFLGALLGVFGAEVDKDDVGDGNIVVPKGSKVGARVDEGLTIRFDGRRGDKGIEADRYGPYDKDGYNHEGFDRYGFDRKGHYDAGYDSTRNESPGRDSGSYDRYGYDRDGHYNPRYDTTRDNPAPNRPSSRGQLQVEIDRKSMHYAIDEQPFRDGWVIMVPLRSTADQLGYSVSQDRAEGSYRLENDTDVLVVEQASRTYSLNRRTGTLPLEVEVRDGIVYAPIDAFTVLTRGSVYVNGTKYHPEP